MNTGIVKPGHKFSYAALRYNHWVLVERVDERVAVGVILIFVVARGPRGGRVPLHIHVGHAKSETLNEPLVGDITGLVV